MRIVKNMTITPQKVITTLILAKKAIKSDKYVSFVELKTLIFKSNSWEAKLKY